MDFILKDLFSYKFSESNFDQALSSLPRPSIPKLDNGNIQVQAKRIPT